MLVLSPPIGSPRKPLAARPARTETLIQVQALAHHIECLLDSINEELRQGDDVTV